MRFDLRGRATTALAATITLPLFAAGLSAAPVAASGGAAAKPRARSHVSVLERRTRVRAGRSARIAGRIRPMLSGRLVVLQRRSRGRWTTITHSRTRAGGRYVLRYRTRRSMSVALRVRVAGGPGLSAGSRHVGRLEAFRPALASWYGEGQALACGGRLTPGMMGVAHKSLPCGTKVTIRYRGRQVRVPVVDRGPFAGPREFDLGPGVRRALRFDGVATVQVAY